MQHMSYRFKHNSLVFLKRLHTSFKGTRGEYRHLLPKPTSWSAGTPNRSKSTKWYKFRKIVQFSSIALLSLPAKSLTIIDLNDQANSVYRTVIQTKILTVASVADTSTFFATDGFQHGFGYDLARSYANNLGVNMRLQAYESKAAALAAVRDGSADMALTTASLAQTEDMQVTAINVSCGRDMKLTKSGLHPKTNWSFKAPNDALAIQASHFLCNSDQLNDTAKLANFYDQNLLKDAYNSQHFENALSSKLPDYKSSFQEQANNYDHDWQLLVAMGYQESHLNADAVSPTGVQGIMMLTNSTAEAMGVSNRVDPYQSIGGGARYLEQMKDTFHDVPNPDKLWFALASYNMGPNAVKRIQRELIAQGDDPRSWSNVYAYLSDNAVENSRYVQCMHYVKNIRSYLESIKTQTT